MKIHNYAKANIHTHTLYDYQCVQLHTNSFSSCNLGMVFFLFQLAGCFEGLWKETSLVQRLGIVELVVCHLRMQLGQLLIAVCDNSEEEQSCTRLLAAAEDLKHFLCFTKITCTCKWLGKFHTSTTWSSVLFINPTPHYRAMYSILIESSTHLTIAMASSFWKEFDPLFSH